MAVSQGWFAEWYAGGWFPPVWFAPGDESHLTAGELSSSWIVRARRRFRR